MAKHRRTNLDNRPEDKVAARIDGTTRRATILAIAGENVRVRFDDDGTEQDLLHAAIERNFSDAARKANRKRTRTPSDAAREGWKTRGTRKVGRPAAERSTTSATVRVYEGTWELLGRAAAAGLIVSRQEVVNTFLDGLAAILRPQLDRLEAEEPEDG
jgi:hypothetical protein